MKLESGWFRIAGMHADVSGEIGAVWLAHDRNSDRVYLYDSALFRREVFAVIADRFKGKGGATAWIPIAWEQSAEEVVNKLKERGCRPLPEGYKDSPAMAEATSREIWERMRAETFAPASHNTHWFEEIDRFKYHDKKVPLDGFPLMSATRHAIGQIKSARRGDPPRRPIEYSNAGIV